MTQMTEMTHSATDMLTAADELHKIHVMLSDRRKHLKGLWPIHENRPDFVKFQIRYLDSKCAALMLAMDLLANAAYQQGPDECQSLQKATELQTLPEPSAQLSNLSPRMDQLTFDYYPPGPLSEIVSPLLGDHLLG